MGFPGFSWSFVLRKITSKGRKEAHFAQESAVISEDGKRDVVLVRCCLPLDMCLFVLGHCFNVFFITTNNWLFGDFMALFDE